MATIDTLVTTYNFEVEQTHNYFVGTEGVLVHNAYSPATVQSILATLTVANAEKWTSFVDRVVSMNVPIAQRTRLYEEISKITNSDDLVRFLDDFEAFEAFRRGIVADVELIAVWKNIVSTRVTKSNILFLRYAKELKDITLAQGKNLYEHIFIGKIGGTNGVSGVHHNSAITTKLSGFVIGDIRVRTGTKVLKSNNLWQVNGAAHMLRLIYDDNHSTNPTFVPTDFEKYYTNPNPFPNCRADAVMGAIICEFKSWGTKGDIQNDEDLYTQDITYPGFTQSKSMFYNLGLGFASTSQFRCYLLQISSMNNLRYYFDVKRSDVTETYVKNTFRQLMYDPATNTLTSKGLEIFNTIWANTALRGDLFPNIRVFNTSTEPTGINEFTTIVSQISNPFYNFIKVE